MNKIRYILCLLVLTTIALPSFAQATWKGLCNASIKNAYLIEMTLEKYGRYENGREVNTIYPSTQNGNAGEEWTLSFNRKGKNTLCMCQSHTRDGGIDITCTFNGNMIYEKTRKQKGVTTNSTHWLKLLSYTSIGDGKFRVLTVDNNNTYRYFIAKPTTLEDNFFEMFLGL